MNEWLPNYMRLNTDIHQIRARLDSVERKYNELNMLLKAKDLELDDLKAQVEKINVELAKNNIADVEKLFNE